MSEGSRLALRKVPVGAKRWRSTVSVGGCSVGLMQSAGAALSTKNLHAFFHLLYSAVGSRKQDRSKVQSGCEKPLSSADHVMQDGVHVNQTAGKAFYIYC